MVQFDIDCLNLMVSQHLKLVLGCQLAAAASAIAVDSAVELPLDSGKVFRLMLCSEVHRRQSRGARGAMASLEFINIQFALPPPTTRSSNWLSLQGCIMDHLPTIELKTADMLKSVNESEASTKRSGTDR